MSHFLLCTLNPRHLQVTSFNIDPGHEVPTELLKISNFVRHFTLWLEFLDNFSNFSEALQVNYLFPKLTSLVIVLGDVFTLAPMTKLFPPTLRDVSFLCSSPFLAFEALDQIHNLGLPLRSIRIICNTTPLICTTLPRYILCMTSLTELWVRRCTVSQQDFLSILQIPTLITLDFSIPRMWTPEHPCHFPRGLPLAPLTSLSLRWSSPVFNRFVLDLLTHLLLLHTLELSLSTSCDTDLLEELLASLAELTQLNHIVIMYTPPHGVLDPQYYSAPSTLFRPVIKACQLKHLVIGNLALADMGLLADLIVSHQPLIEYLELTAGSNYSSDPPPPGWFFDWRNVVAILTACPALRHIRVPFYTPWRISDDVPPNVRLHSHRLLVHTSEIACWSGDWSCTHSFLSSLIPLMVLSKYIIDQ